MSKKVKYSCHFQEEWLESFSWLKHDPKETTKVFCVLSKKSFSMAVHDNKTLDMPIQSSKSMSRLPPSTQSTLDFKITREFVTKQGPK